MSLNDYTNYIISNALEEIESEGSSSQLQTVIHPELLFRYNTINLLVSRRGVGKTFTVMKEMIKLSQLPNCGGYTSFLYVTDKNNDETVNTMIKLIKLKVRQVTYSDFLSVLRDLVDAKNAYSDVLEKGVFDDVTEKTKQDLFSTLDLKEWLPEIPHTAILMDDAINILSETKFKPVRDLLFQNRQPRLTVFICVQDIFGIPVQLRRNCDTIFLFAGMTDRMAFGMMVKQLGIHGLVKWDTYRSLPERGILLVDYIPQGVKLRFVDGSL
jgi:hypothetical protein